MFPTRTVGTLKNKIYWLKKETILEAIYFKGLTKLTESSQPCLAACHVEPAQLQNWTERDIKELLDADVRIEHYVTPTCMLLTNILL